MSVPIIFSSEVARAREAGGPLVALESTLLAHGLPWPRSLEAGLAMEAEVRSAGAVPATIAVLEGRVHVGLDASQLERVAWQRPAKASRRDLGAALASGASVATTVAGTLAVMQLAGLRVLATGGIGGVHRQAEETFDISADLLELARARAVVVCAGAKAVLDLPRTLEVLETLGVPTLTYGTDEFPAFYARGSGLRGSARVDSAQEAARIALAHWRLGGGGVLLAAPVPERWALPDQELATAIAAALRQARDQGVRGAEVTPFLLGAVASATEGRSVEANLALLRNNAGVAARLAVALAEEGEPC